MQLQITWESMESIVATLGVMPEFWDVLRTFGNKISDDDESSGGFYHGDRSGFPGIVVFLSSHQGIQIHD